MNRDIPRPIKGLLLIAVALFLVSSVLGSTQTGGQSGILSRPIEMVSGISTNILDYIALGTVIAAIVYELIHLLGGESTNSKKGPLVLGITAVVIIFSDALFGQSFVQLINSGAIRSTLYLFMLLYVVLVISTRSSIQENMMGRESVIPTSRLVLVYSVVSATNGLFISVQQGTEILSAFLFHLLTGFIAIQVISRFKLKKAKEKEEKQYSGIFSKSENTEQESKHLKELQKRLESVESEHEREKQELQEELQGLKEQNKNLSRDSHHIEDGISSIEQAVTQKDPEAFHDELEELEQYFKKTDDNLSSVVSDHTQRMMNEKKDLYHSDNLEPLFDERLREEENQIKETMQEHKTLSDPALLKQSTQIGMYLSMLEQAYAEYAAFMKGKREENPSYEQLRQNKFRQILDPLQFLIKKTNDSDFKQVEKRIRNSQNEKEFYQIIRHTIELINSKINIYRSIVEEQIKEQQSDYQKHREYAQHAKEEIGELRNLEDQEIALQEQIIELGNSLRVISQKLGEIRASQQAEALDEKTMKYLNDYIAQFNQGIQRLVGLQNQLHDLMKEEKEIQSNIIPFYKGLQIKESEIKRTLGGHDTHAS